MPPKKEEKKDEKKAGDKKDDKKADKKDEKKGGKTEKKAGTKKKREYSEEEMEAMKPRNRRKARKNRFKIKLEECLATFKNVLVVGVDNVGSSQMAKIRLALRSPDAKKNGYEATILMGKNTMLRTMANEYAARTKDDSIKPLLSHVVGNIGLVFTNATDLNKVRHIIMDNKVPAAAKSGSDAPDDVFIEPGPTGLDPGQTNFFQALSIPTKINKGSIEISSKVHLIKKGERITLSQVALLTKLDKKPFFYGIKVFKVFESGSVYDAAVLDIKPEDLLARFVQGVRYVAALGLRVGHPSAATVPHSISQGFKFLLSLSLATNYEFKEAKAIKDLLANPGALAAAQAASAGASSAAPAAAAKVEEAPKEEEEEGGDLGLSLFD